MKAKREVTECYHLSVPRDITGELVGVHQHTWWLRRWPRKVSSSARSCLWVEFATDDEVSRLGTVLHGTLETELAEFRLGSCKRRGDWRRQGSLYL